MYQKTCGEAYLPVATGRAESLCCALLVAMSVSQRLLNACGYHRRCGCTACRKEAGLAGHALPNMPKFCRWIIDNACLVLVPWQSLRRCMHCWIVACSGLLVSSLGGRCVTWTL